MTDENDPPPGVSSVLKWIDWQRRDGIMPFLQLLASDTNMTRGHKKLKLIH
jgi:hypothetical protein